MKKGIFRTALLTIFAALLLCQPVLADGTTSDWLTGWSRYTIDGSNIILKDYTGDETEVTVYATAQVEGITYNVLLEGDHVYAFTPHVKKIYIKEGVALADDISALFNYSTSLDLLDINYVDTSNVTNMRCLFGLCSNLAYLDIRHFNTSNVTNMNEMFIGCESLVNLDVSSFDTSNVTDMSEMFYLCESLNNLDVSNFDTSNVTSMNTMFDKCSSLTSLNLSNFNTANVTDMFSMFSDCESLSTLNLNNYDTSNVTDMGYMFENCRSLTSLDLSSFDMSNVTDAEDMLYGMDSLSTIYTPRNLSLSVELPATFYDEAGNEYTELPTNNSQSIRLTRTRASANSTVPNTAAGDGRQLYAIILAISTLGAAITYPIRSKAL